jgi:hypothetical protein
VRDGARDTLTNIGKIAEGVVEGRINLIREGAGGLVLDNNLATAGARKAAQELFPEIPDEEIFRGYRCRPSSRFLPRAIYT